MRDELLAKQLGAIIRHLRLERKMSQEEFAERCDLHRTYIGSIERGEKTITIETASKIAKALKVPLSQLLLQLEAEQSSKDDDNRS